ncbi:Pex12 amino terminal region-domain-containing protein [Echria macrotheca]|uniref:Peroxisome assembly protein 12 n=1 Tax=Echria macrotheca TaxID=438768 RepID=A0AAJ0FC49_9PEZI|nr:Pex12 amino terminal region-domain-containing protein [Echria macrotheca]
MEFVTALRGTFDPAKPSLFELLSEQQLSSLLPPTLRYLLTVLTHRYPRRLLPLLNRFDELYALLSLAVERHYLLTRAGSFTEHFYGLKREPSLASEIPRAASGAPSLVRDALRLSRRDIRRNLFVLIAIPYLKRKLDEAYEVDAPRALLGAAYNQPPPQNAPARERLAFYARWFLRNVYPSLNAAYYFAVLAFNLAYLFDGSRFHDPFLWLIGTRVRRMGVADYKAIEALEQQSTKRGRLVGALSMVLPTSIFALKFLEWWYASDFAKQLSRKAAEGLDLPPPVVPGLVSSPPKATRLSAGRADEEKEGEDDDGEKDEKDAPIAATSLRPIFTVVPPKDSALCPICRDEIVTPTACQTGVVYCYTCIHKWVAGSHPRQEAFMAPEKKERWESGEGRCAVTGRRVLGGTEGLRRIMV